MGSRVAGRMKPLPRRSTWINAHCKMLPDDTHRHCRPRQSSRFSEPSLHMSGKTWAIKSSKQKTVATTRRCICLPTGIQVVISGRKAVILISGDVIGMALANLGNRAGLPNTCIRCLSNVLERLGLADIHSKLKCTTTLGNRNPQTAILQSIDRSSNIGQALTRTGCHTLTKLAVMVSEPGTPGPMLRLRANSPNLVHQATAHLYVMPRVRRTWTKQANSQNPERRAPRLRMLRIVFFADVLVIAG